MCNINSIYNTYIICNTLYVYIYIYIYFGLFAIYWAAPMAHGGFQARIREPNPNPNQSCSHQPTPEPQQCQIRVKSATYTTAHGNTGSLTH